MTSRSRCLSLALALVCAAAVPLAGCDRAPVVPLPSPEAMSKDSMLGGECAIRPPRGSRAEVGH